MANDGSSGPASQTPAMIAHERTKLPDLDLEDADFTFKVVSRESEEEKRARIVTNKLKLENQLLRETIRDVTILITGVLLIAAAVGFCMVQIHADKENQKWATPILASIVGSALGFLGGKSVGVKGKSEGEKGE
jgi:hypothetical protein